MPARPPDTTVPHPAAPTTAVIAGPAAATAEIAVHGSWSRRLGVEVTAALRTCFAGRPSVILVDLHDMDDAAAASLPLWRAARRVAHVLQSPAHLALSLPPATLLERRLRRIGARRLPLYATMAEARAAVTDPFLDYREQHIDLRWDRAETVPRPAAEI